MAKTPPREPEMIPPNLGVARRRTEYTDDDDGRWDKSERGIEENEACMTEGWWHEYLHLWLMQDEFMRLGYGRS